MDQSMRPLKIYFEVTNRCNFSCEFCPSRGLRRERQHMDFALFQKGIDEIAAGHLTNTVGFHVMGEPLLYPHLADAIRYAKSRGLSTEINTNGSLLTGDRLSRLVEAGLDEMSISLQVMGEHDHAGRGSALPFDTYYGRVLEAARLVKASGSSMDVIVCSMDTSTSRYFDIDRPLGLNRDRGAYRAKLLRLVLDLRSAAGRPTDPSRAQAALGRLNLVQPQFIRVDEHLAIYAQPLMDWGNAFTSRHVYPVKIGYCGYALSNLGVLSNGEVTICCGDYEGRTALGNLRTRSLAEMLASKQARAIEAGFQRMRVIHPHCQHCLGSPNPLKALFKGLGSIYLFKLLAFQPARVREVGLLAV